VKGFFSDTLPRAKLWTLKSQRTFLNRSFVL
jgi:hypothetical protein